MPQSTQSCGDNTQTSRVTVFLVNHNVVIAVKCVGGWASPAFSMFCPRERMGIWWHIETTGIQEDVTDERGEKRESKSCSVRTKFCDLAADSAEKLEVDRLKKELKRESDKGYIYITLFNQNLKNHHGITRIRGVYMPIWRAPESKSQIQNLTGEERVKTKD